LGWSVAARMIIHNYCNMLREAEAKIEKIEPANVELPKL
jgi:hypothetical protein